MNDDEFTTPQSRDLNDGFTETNSESRNGHATKEEQPKAARSERAEISTKTPGNKSTGPRTAVGKKRSSRNALKQGIFSTKFLLTDESRSEFTSLLSVFTEQFQPRTGFQDLIVEDLVLIRIRQGRVQEAERAEIVLARDFIELDLRLEQRKQLYEVEESGYLRMGQLRACSNPYVTSQCLTLLKLIREDLLLDKFDPKKDYKTLVYIYGITWAVNLGSTFLIGSKWLIDRIEAAKMNPGDETNRQLKEAKEVTLGGLELEIEELTSMRHEYALVEQLRTKYYKQAALVPSSEKSERLLRYSAYWSRKFDRKVTLLERLQRMHRGHSDHRKRLKP